MAKISLTGIKPTDVLTPEQRANSPALSEAMRSLRPVSGLTTLRVIAQAIAIDSSINSAMTTEAVRTIDQNEVSIADIYCAVPIIRCHGAKPRPHATLSSGVGSVLLRRNV